MPAFSALGSVISRGRAVFTLCTRSAGSVQRDPLMHLYQAKWNKRTEALPLRIQIALLVQHWLSALVATINKALYSVLGNLWLSLSAFA